MHVNADRNKVLVGQDGWLFLNNDTNRTLEQVEGRYPLSATFDQDWARLFALRRERLTRLGCSYIFAVAPAKECVYANKLPGDLRVSDDRPVFRVLGCAAGVVATYYPLDLLLRSRRASTEPYPKGDTHWDFVGAFIAYEGLMCALGLPTLSQDRITTQTIEHECDLSMKLGHTSPFVRGTIKQPRAKRTFDNKIKNIGHRVDFDNEDHSLPSCVIFRDSFSIPQLPLLAEGFRRLTAIWQPNIDYTILDSERPDFVISQHAERFLVVCPDDVGGRSHELNVRLKLEKAQ